MKMRRKTKKTKKKQTFVISTETQCQSAMRQTKISVTAFDNNLMYNSRRDIHFLVQLFLLWKFFAFFSVFFFKEFFLFFLFGLRACLPGCLLARLVFLPVATLDSASHTHIHTHTQPNERTKNGNEFNKLERRVRMGHEDEIRCREPELQCWLLVTLKAWIFLTETVFNNV